LDQKAANNVQIVKIPFRSLVALVAAYPAATTSQPVIDSPRGGYRRGICLAFWRWILALGHFDLLILVAHIFWSTTSQPVWCLPLR